jgi:hypothetical protein
MRPTGGVFFREGAGIDAKKLVAKVCDGGRITTDDARAATGTERVGFAVHQPRRGFWAVVDSADGALGIAKGDWSKVALAANHLRTDAIWYRTYAIDLGLAVYFPQGGTWMRAYAGVADDVIHRLDADGVPVHESQPPATATDALLACVAYEPGTYETGPDAALARKLLAIHEALVAGDAAALRERFADVTEERSLALAIVRGADRGAWRACLQACANDLVAAPPRMRGELGKLTFDEEILRRAGELAETEAALLPVLDHLDAIEADAGTRSSHAHPAGVAMLAYQLGKRGAHDLVLACELRLLRRADPAWYTCNNVLGTLLKRSPFSLDAPAREAIRLVEARLPDLGQSAIDSITYNLACVFSRAGDLERALVELRRCETPREQNAHPDRDTDLEPLWSHPEFQTLISPKASEPELVAELEPEYVVPPEHAVPRFELDFADRPDAEGLVIDRLGGKPNAPSSDFTWPVSSSRPMSLIIQLIGKAGGGAIDLGDIHTLQVFADMEGDYYEPSEHAVIAHRAPCVAVVEPPATVELAEVRAITLKPGFDDRRILDDDFESDAARTHVWCDKVFGVPVGANLDPELRDDQGEPMRLILELVTTDDYFLWALFANQQWTQFRLEIVRG